MSMHDIEGVVECSIRCIDKSNLPVEEKRNLIYNLYRFHDQWDTGYTHFRVKDILLRYHYMFALPLQDHPDYPARKEEFDKLAGEPHTAWVTNDSYYEGKDEGGRFYFDAGSATWQHLVDKGMLTGEQAQPVQEIPLLDVILKVLICCREQQDVDCAAQWYTTIMYYILWDLPDSDQPKLQPIADILHKGSVFATLQNDYYFTRGLDEMKEELDTEDSEAVPALAKTWLDAYLNWEKQLEQNPDDLLQKTIQLYRAQNFAEALVTTKKGLAIAPGHRFLRLYEAIINVILLSGNNITDIQQYAQWADVLHNLHDECPEDNESGRTIKAHSLYYLALLHAFCRKWDEAHKIIDELVNTYQMKEEAEELVKYMEQIKALG